MPFRSKGKLQNDLKQIAIDRINSYDENAYSNLDRASKSKIDSYTFEQVEAIRAFLERQELNITDMEAVGMIKPGQIKVMGGLTAPSGPPGVPVPLVNPAMNTAPIKFMVQISQTSNKVGLPDVFRNVKKSVIKFLNTVF